MYAILRVSCPTHALPCALSNVLNSLYSTLHARTTTLCYAYVIFWKRALLIVQVVKKQKREKGKAKARAKAKTKENSWKLQNSNIKTANCGIEVNSWNPCTDQVEGTGWKLVKNFAPSMTCLARVVSGWFAMGIELHSGTGYKMYIASYFRSGNGIVCGNFRANRSLSSVHKTASFWSIRVRE